MRHFTRLAPALLLGLALAAMPDARAVPTWGARESSPASTPPESLKPGEWIWGGISKGWGPMAVIVSLTEQRAYAYRNGILIGVTTISSGKKGYETPTGVFTILQKDKDHRSNVYNNAPMPYQQRLTWGGVALHAGGLPGYPESHGCVHLPTEFARLLFDNSNMGMVVVVSEAGISPALIHAVISAESGYNPFARSRKGAAGLMQLMPETAKRYGVKNRLDPAQNISGGARYLRDLIRMFNNDVQLAIAAYNAGENAVVRAGNRIPPYSETMTYVPRVMTYYRKYRATS